MAFILLGILAAIIGGVLEEREVRLRPPGARRPMYLWSIGVFVVLVWVFTSGCVNPVRVELPQPDDGTRTALATLLNTPAERARDTPPGDRLEVVRRVDDRVLPAAIRVCERTFSEPQTCASALGNRNFRVLVDDEGINAGVDDYGVIVLGGLVRSVGSDDELALVVAHEYSHTLFGHLQKSRDRAESVGVLSGILAGLIAVRVGMDDETTGELVSGGSEFGSTMGFTAFSKDMELEADHVALFIVDEAGYDLDLAMQFFQRTMQLQHQMNLAGRGETVGFFQTHPSDEERLLQLLATKRLIERGKAQPSGRQ